MTDRRVVYVHAGVASDAGCRREENQDYFLVADLSVPSEAGGLLLAPTGEAGRDVGEGDFLLGARGALLLVADGMGGAAAGSVASRVAATTVHETLRAARAADGLSDPERMALHLREAVDAANSTVHRAAEAPGHRGMGTTLTVVGIVDDTGFVAQVGDSRAYLVRDGAARQLTRDQSLAQMMVEAGALTAEEGERSRHGNMLLQAVGAEPAVRSEITYQRLRRDDTLVVCSDGLFRLVRPEEIADASARHPQAAALCEHLVALAIDRGGPDNVTVVAARLGGIGLDVRHPDDEVGWRLHADGQA